MGLMILSKRGLINISLLLYGLSYLFLQISCCKICLVGINGDSPSYANPSSLKLQRTGATEDRQFFPASAVLAWPSPREASLCRLASLTEKGYNIFAIYFLLFDLVLTCPLYATRCTLIKSVSLLGSKIKAKGLRGRRRWPIAPLRGRIGCVEYAKPSISSVISG
jgi:hypothetical protein